MLSHGLRTSQPPAHRATSLASSRSAHAIASTYIRFTSRIQELSAFKPGRAVDGDRDQPLIRAREEIRKALTAAMTESNQSMEKYQKDTLRVPPNVKEFTCLCKQYRHTRPSFPEFAAMCMQIEY
ncbi:hypothetical protein BC628DRAFT_1029457 [Trametes gibbosa]|nr:hypothetical protein BC628DRAFT_1029457 [Trametes gibbosa]